jgi:hypothetical protein
MYRACLRVSCVTRTVDTLMFGNGCSGLRVACCHAAMPRVAHRPCIVACCNPACCRLQSHVAMLFDACCPFCMLHGVIACGSNMLQCCMLHATWCSLCAVRCMLSVVRVACCIFACVACMLHIPVACFTDVLRAARLVRCVLLLHVAIIAAYWDSRRILGFKLHLASCVFHVAHRMMCLANAAAAAPTDAGALAHARGAWVGTYPITVVPASPMTASLTTVGKAAATSA